jgi:sterol desaturase/sphingolipid hydroxylase (fatty acid hydroxylase superfamily)
VVAGIFVAAIFAWTLAEYLLHRFVFHYVDERPWVQRFHYLVHGVHHEYPSDPHHLFMPPVPSLILASLFGGLFYLLMGRYGVPFLAGFIVGYLMYSTMHYLMHRVKNPPAFLRGLWRHHHLHHFKSPDKAFGVSSPLWDWVFGTMPERR